MKQSSYSESTLGVALITGFYANGATIIGGMATAVSKSNQAGNDDF